MAVRARGLESRTAATLGAATHMTHALVSTDSSPKWFTQVDLDGYERATEATLFFLPQIELTDAQYTRVQFEEVDPRVTPSPIPAGE